MKRRQKQKNYFLYKSTTSTHESRVDRGKVSEINFNSKSTSNDNTKARHQNVMATHNQENKKKKSSDPKPKHLVKISL